MGNMSLSPKSSTSLVLYLDLLSQPCRAVLIFCRLAHIPVTVRFVSLKRREHLSLSANPTRKLPFLQAQSFSLSESHAILTYLCTVHKCADHWYPKDPKGRAVCDQFLHWHHGALRNVERYLHYWLEERRDGGVSPALLASFVTEMEDAMSRLDGWLADKQFVLGPEMSIYDLSAVCELAEMKLVPGLFAASLSKYPSLKQWFERVYSLPSVQEAHAVVEKLAAKYSRSSHL